MATKEDRKPITVRIKPSTLKAARVASAKAGQKFGDWLEEAIRKGIKG